ncbi:hypothetical protein HD554DRAFT_2030685 [Boletus coccyginus]|nr:hypothetical protein HD554DRAFT_2030685 [Boletus coccyginus]
MLWEVKEIIAESGSEYKVDWAGADPGTGKPWEPSWVSKSDCTDLAVAQWEAKKIGKVNSKNAGSRNTTSKFWRYILLIMINDFRWRYQWFQKREASRAC